MGGGVLVSLRQQKRARKDEGRLWQERSFRELLQSLLLQASHFSVPEEVAAVVTHQSSSPDTRSVPL